MQKGNSDLVDVTLMFYGFSPSKKAIFVANDEESKRISLPCSQIEFIYKASNIIECTMPEWLAKEKELI